MTLLQLIQTTEPNAAKLIDKIIEFSSEVADRLELGDGNAGRDGPAGWDRNKLLKTPASKLNAILIYLRDNQCRKANYYSDFTGESAERQSRHEP